MEYRIYLAVIIGWCTIPLYACATGSHVGYNFDQSMGENLLSCVHRGDDKRAEWLLQNGANVAYYDQYGRQPIHISTSSWDVYLSGKMIDMLIRNGADVNATTQGKRMTPCHVFSQYSQNVPHLCKMITHGSHVNLRDNLGRAPLHLAAKDNVEAVQILLGAGADINPQACHIDGDPQNDKNNTPLHVAVRTGHYGIVCTLLKWGARVNLQNMRGVTPFNYTVQSHNPLMLIDMMRYGADFTSISQDNCDNMPQQSDFAQFREAGLGAYYYACREICSRMCNKAYLERSDIPDMIARVQYDEQIYLYAQIALSHGWWEVAYDIIHKYVDPRYYPDILLHAIRLATHDGYDTSQLRAYIHDLRNLCTREQLCQAWRIAWENGSNGNELPHVCAYFLWSEPDIKRALRVNPHTYLHAVASQFQMTEILPLVAASAFDTASTPVYRDGCSPVQYARQCGNLLFCHCLPYICEIRRILVCSHYVYNKNNGRRSVTEKDLRGMGQRVSPVLHPYVYKKHIVTPHDSSRMISLINGMPEIARYILSFLPGSSAFYNGYTCLSHKSQ